MPRPPAARARPRYQPHPLLDRERAAKEGLEASTGRSFEAWLALARRRGGDARALKRWLKEEHGLKDMLAHWVAFEALQEGGASYDDPLPMVEALYAGPKAALRPVHEAVVDAVLDLGDDVIVTACKTMVPVYRKHVFAELRPGDGVVELRLSLGDRPAQGRLERPASRPDDGRLTHRVRLSARTDVDAELRGWLRLAYAAGAARIARSTRFRPPPELLRALKGAPAAARTWTSMTPAMRRDMAEWIASARQEATKARRLAAALARLGAGHRRVY